jgi:predicted dinucleotide-binding enzyme
MDIGIIGAGSVARAFAGKAINAGHSVVLSNSRGPDSLHDLVADIGPRATAASIADAANKPVVLLAVPWPKVEAALNGVPAWNGQILIDATNAFADGTPANGLENFGDSSSSEHVASLARGARVVKAMNSLFMKHFAAEQPDGRYRRAMFVSGDDAAARTTVGDLFESLGFAPIDLGSLKVGGRIQAVGKPIAGHDFFVPWPAPRTFPAFNGEGLGR